MKPILALLLLGLSACQGVFAKPSSVSYTEPTVSGLKLKVVTVNFQDPDVRLGVVLSQNRIGAAESFPAMMTRVRPDAAITGTFFSNGSLFPTGDIVIGGKLVWFGPIGTGVAITRDNRLQFVDTTYGRHTDWSAYQTVLGGGLRLVKAGRVWVAPRSEGFRDPSLFRARQRTAVAMTKSNKLLMVTTHTPVKLERLAKALTALGATEAVAMDGGSSTGLYYRGSFISRPQRSLTNVLAVYSTHQRYLASVPALGPYAFL